MKQFSRIFSKHDIKEKANDERKEEEKDGTSTSNNKSKKEDQRQKKKHVKETISWLGTSVSKVLNKEKFEKDLNVNLKMTRAYCIKEEDNARYKDVNFKEMVPKVIERDDPDTIVLQTGSIEITNIDVNNALMDTKKHLNEYRREWFEKVEKDSENLFNIAKEALEKSKNVRKVIIVKRISRFDRSSSDLIGIKSQLSRYANSVYDQLWIKNGSPENIILIDLDLECTGYFRDLVYGKYDDTKFDGIHLSGKGAVRQFTYRVIKQLKEKVYSSVKGKPSPSQVDNHIDCPQALYQRTNQNRDNHHGSQSQSSNRNVQTHLYSDTVKGNNTEHRYNVPIYNLYENLNC